MTISSVCWDRLQPPTTINRRSNLENVNKEFPPKNLNPEKRKCVKPTMYTTANCPSLKTSRQGFSGKKDNKDKTTFASDEKTQVSVNY